MCPGVITYDVTDGELLLDDMRITCHLVPNTEETSPYSVLLKNIENLWCILRIWAIIKCQRNFWYMYIAAVDNTVLLLQACYLFLQSYPAHKTLPLLEGT